MSISSVLSTAIFALQGNTAPDSVKDLFADRLYIILVYIS